MNNEQFVKKLKDVKACPEAIEYVECNKYSMREAWDHCERADWLLWLVFKMELMTKRDRIHIVCDCAETALKYVPKGEDRPKKVIEATRRYADNPTEDNRNAANAAANAAYAANAANAAAYAANAADAAAYAAYAANAAYATANAADAANATANAANAAYAAANAVNTKKQAHIEMCHIIRERIRI